MSLTRDDLHGIFPAYPTPTDAEGRVNAAVLRRQVEYLLEGGVNGLVPIGGTGEYPALSPAERRRVVEVTVEAARGRAPVIAGILNPGFGDAVAAGEAFRAAGADALMLIVPYYVTPTQSGIRDYFRAFRDRIDLPILLYDIPYRTRIAIDPETIAALAEEGTIIGMKACNTDVAHFNRIVHLAGRAMAVLGGEDGLFPVHVDLGAPGAVLATASLIPRYWVDLFALLREGRRAEALARHRALLPLLDAVFAEPNPGPLKEAMSMIGFDMGAPLLPLLRPGQETRRRLEQVIRDLRAQGIVRA